MDTERILEYNAQVNSFIVALKVRLLEKGVAPLGEFNERVIQAMHVMTAGHGRTLQHMVEKMKNGLLSDEITDNWRKIANRKKNIEPLLLLRLISERRDIFTFSHPPETDVERDVILGCRVHDAIDDVVFRCMLDENKCFIHRRESSGFGDRRFMATTTLASFFGMIQSIKDMSSGLGHLSRAAATLFCTLGHTMSLATVWERCRAMALVSRAKMLGDLCTVDMVFAVNDGSLCREDIPLLPLNVEARLAEDVSDLQYTENTVLVAPKSQAGWDIVVYSRDGYCHFEQVKVAMPKSFEAMPAYSIENLIAHSLEGILKFYWDTLGIETETHGEEFAQLEKERELLGKVTFVLSIADCNAPKWVKCSIDTMLEVLHHRQKVGIGSCHSNLVIRYVEQHWDNVGYLDWDDLRKCMPPLLLPFAQLAHAAQTPEIR